MVARWIANLILLLMLIGLGLGIRYEWMVTESSRLRDAYPAKSGEREADWRPIEPGPDPADGGLAPSPAPSAAPRPVAVATPDPAPTPLGIRPDNGSPGRPDAPVGAPTAAGPTREPLESPPVVRLSPDGGQPTLGPPQDQAATEGALEDGAGTRPIKAAPQGFGVDPFAPDDGPPPEAGRSKSGGASKPRSH